VLKGEAGVEALRPGREPRMFMWSRPLERVKPDTLIAMIGSRLFETVVRRTIMREEAGKS